MKPLPGRGVTSHAEKLARACKRCLGQRAGISPERRSCVVADVADIAIEGFDVVAVRVEEVCRVVPRAVVPVAGLAVRAEPALDTRAVEPADLLLLPRVEAEVEVLRRRSAVGDVQVCEAASRTSYLKPPCRPLLAGLSRVSSATARRRALPVSASPNATANEWAGRRAENPHARALILSEASALGFSSSPLLGRNRSVEASGMCQRNVRPKSLRWQMSSERKFG
jgi:hypothetical protein